MSIDLEWSKLDSSLSHTLVDVLNKQLSTTTKPSFIGPIEVISIDFGTVAPDIELVDLRDIHRDFLEDEDDEKEAVKATASADDEDGFEWVSRKAARREEGLAFQQLPHFGRGGPMNMFASTPTLHSPHSESHWTYSSEHPAPPSTSNPHPNLQLHLHINWHSDLRITLTTSLLINYPSPMFMSLPIKLSITGLIFTGELAVAYEGERGRVHLCILDDLDPYGPAVERPKRDSNSPIPSATPPEDDPESIHPPRAAKPLPIGQRLLPSIFIESEIGQADKHVLKNVNRVERFIQDVIRKAVEEELVFPNFHTMVLGGKEGG
ncbi:hypothetical protein EV361DRAFT_796394 [Lentinula raphanica]|nr:hypothetical protein EV360DRAFT_38272 [Lentinula raphanica]KAJ3776805.1 hypothetical protein FB446DRAFT_635319 [Lentinula raphanica]KAJ3973325.1 hypothetical protein EV361DRAFT_796394 [Lentinula raphanica]